MRNYWTWVFETRQEWLEKSINSPHFRRWFGNSKVVDRSGKPLRVYHGSKNATFNKFNIGQLYDGTNKPAVVKKAFFTANPDYASKYTTHDFQPTRKLEAPGIYPVYLSIQNPLDLEAYMRNEIGDVGYSVADWIRHGYDGAFSDEGGGTWIAFYPHQIKSAIANQGTFDPNNQDIDR